MDGATPIFNFNYCCAVFGTKKQTQNVMGRMNVPRKKSFSPQRAAKEKAILSIILKQTVKQ